MQHKSDEAIRKKALEDSLIICGEFDVVGHRMNYVLRVSTFGTKNGIHCSKVYFGLLDDTTREYSEQTYSYDANQVIVEDNKLMIRTDKFELSDSVYGLKIYISYETFTLDFLLNHDDNLLKPQIKGRDDSDKKNGMYAYPNCTTVGSVSISNEYFNVNGTASYIRHYHDNPNFFERRFARFSKQEEEKMNTVFGFFTLSNGLKITYLTIGNETTYNDFFVTFNRFGVVEEKTLFPIQNIVNYYMNLENKDEEYLMFELKTFDERIKLRVKRKMNIMTDLSPEHPEHIAGDRFTRIVGDFEGNKVSGFGYLSVTNI